MCKKVRLHTKVISLSLSPSAVTSLNVSTASRSSFELPRLSVQTGYRFCTGPLKWERFFLVSICAACVYEALRRTVISRPVVSRHIVQIGPRINQCIEMKRDIKLTRFLPNLEDLHTCFCKAYSLISFYLSGISNAASV